VRHLRYGPGGPYAEKKAYDPAGASARPAFGVTRHPDPARHGRQSRCEQSAAGMYGVFFQPRRAVPATLDGVGATWTSQCSNHWGEWMGCPPNFTSYAARRLLAPARATPTIVPDDRFKAATARRYFLSIQKQREFERCCDAVLLNSALKTMRDFRFDRPPPRAANRSAMQCGDLEDISDIMRRQAPCNGFSGRARER